jgi:hypothetical protein
VVGINIGICLACGTTYTAPVADIWQTGNYLAAPGMSNLFGAAGSFATAMIQFEPGPICTQLMDLPFSGPNGNLEACQRFYAKSYSYPYKAGSVASLGAIWWLCPVNTTALYTPVRFPRTMAKVPTVTGYSTSTGAANNVYTGASDIAISSVNAVGDAGFGGFNLSTSMTAGFGMNFNYTADTGW